MNFVSFTFLSFLILVFFLYFLVPKKHQWIVLLISSYAFYLFSGFKTVIFLIVATFVVFFSGLLIEKSNNTFSIKKEQLLVSNSSKDMKIWKEKYQKQKTTVLTIGLLVVFIILGLLKYFNFLANNINHVINLLNLGFRIPILDLLIPLGLSFYTFQSAGYLIDVYRGKIPADRNLLKFALFVSFFPQLVQGPISRYSDLANQLYSGHNFDYVRIKFGAQLILWGLFKKLVIADRAAIIVNNVFLNYLDYEGLSILIAVMIYGIQIYCDFSGGIDMARGIAQIFGINLTDNFARPFFATSLSDFWRRWHITLGAWVRDYVFYPITLSKSFTKLGRISRKLLGNNFGKMVPMIFAMVITFLIIGIWHGAQWKYVFYGLYNGFIISLGIVLTPFFKKANNIFKIKTNIFSWHLFQIVGTFFLVTFGRYFTRAVGFMAGWELVKQTFKIFNPWIFFDGSLYKLGLDRSSFHLLLVLIVFLLMVDFLQERGVNIREKISQQNLLFRWTIYLLAIFSIIIFGIYGIGYDAASFIYRGF